PVMTALLRESFDVVGIVSDGQAALESTLKLLPDLVVLAISMPGMSGIEVAQELKRRGNNAKIVFLTVHEDSDILARALAAGGLGYVAKVRMDIDLIPAINEAFADRIFVSRLSKGRPTKSAQVVSPPYRKCYPARMPLKSATLRG
ncbi:MAG TPA: response regulator transcription factor, partial [Candidatus Acidoferrum sp.]